MLDSFERNKSAPLACSVGYLVPRFGRVISTDTLRLFSILQPTTVTPARSQTPEFSSHSGKNGSHLARSWKWSRLTSWPMRRRCRSLIKYRRETRVLIRAFSRLGCARPSTWLYAITRNRLGNIQPAAVLPSRAQQATERVQNEERTSFSLAFSSNSIHICIMCACINISTVK